MSEGPGRCGRYPQSTSKALMPWGLRRVDINASTSALLSLPKSLSLVKALRAPILQVPHSPPRCWDPWQEKNVYLKADSSKGVGAGGS